MKGAFTYDSTNLATETKIPKLCLYMHPGGIIKDDDLDYVRDSFPNIKMVDVGEGGNAITNTVSVSGDETDPDTSNNSDTEVINVNAGAAIGADLELCIAVLA